MLIGILIMILAFRIFAPDFLTSPEPDFTEFDRMVLALEKAKRKQLEVELEAAKAKTIEFNRPDREIAEVKLKPFYFDPNSMTEELWLELGLNTRQIRNIQNYLGSGGSFRKKEDFRRIYTISDDEYDILEPYIIISEEDEKTKSQTESELFGETEETHPLNNISKTQTIDINHADTLELLRVRGIGPAFARRIIRYRDLLGGFHSPDQLLEVYGIDSVKYNQISGSFYFDPAALNLIDVNKAEVKDLTAHPYIDYYLAKSIIDIRIKKGSLLSDADLYGIPLMHDALYVKIIPYFRFNDTNDE